MTIAPDRTHDAAAACWVASARRAGTDFPVQNLPFGAFRRAERGEGARLGVAIGDEVLDLSALVARRLLDGLPPDLRAAAVGRSLNPLMALGRAAAGALRARLFDLLTAPEHQRAAGECLVPLEAADLLLPVEIGDYTDFYASIDHARNIGSMFRPDNPLLPNYKYIPIGYHGRASSIVISGTPVRRPRGQTRPDDAAEPVFGPVRGLDYECEVGAFVAGGNALGVPIPIAEAEQHLFGLCLLNDWSARDLQRWEYQPLGPFLAKSFASTVSPWVVTVDALTPFRVPAADRPGGDPAPLPYLADPGDRAGGGFDITLEVHLASQRMRKEGLPPVRLSRAPFRSMYWTLAQMLTHHSSNGCNLRPGDLLGSGTVSGPLPENRGCLLELTGRGAEPVALPTGESRRFLEDGDEVTLRGYAERDGFRRVGFGECRGTVVAA